MVFTVGALFSFQVQAANGVSVQLPIDQSDIDAALATARTPLEAARTFAKLVTPAIAQAVAEALQRTLERTQAATDAIANPTTQDMFSSSANSALRLGPTEPNSRSALHWPSPGLSASGNLPAVVVQAANTVVSTPGPLTITVTGTF
jgi:hypothetical protein